MCLQSRLRRWLPLRHGIIGWERSGCSWLAASAPLAAETKQRTSNKWLGTIPHPSHGGGKQSTYSFQAWKLIPALPPVSFSQPVPILLYSVTSLLIPYIITSSRITARCILTPTFLPLGFFVDFPNVSSLQTFVFSAEFPGWNTVFPLQPLRYKGN